MKILVSAVVNPTEDWQKILKAVENIFPSIEFKDANQTISGIGKKEDLEAFRELLKIQQIRDAARGFLFNRIDGDNLFFGLNKQAAFMGGISFVDFDIALGTINIEIKAAEYELEELIEWLCEKGDKEQRNRGKQI